MEEEEEELGEKGNDAKDKESSRKIGTVKKRTLANAQAKYK